MDEPDAFLSSTGQQDLLRVLEEFAEPESGSRHDQVVYVTHSPFLINKNAAHRIRVLDKGSEEEGTRVVRDAARNHYEPLRSSVGAYVAETAFIGGSNLVVEGVSDQVLLVGMNSLLRRDGTAPRELLDLNSVTIVPAGSASEVPYIVYLARGRDETKPPCVALLDGDRSGEDAEKGLARGGASGKRVLDGKYIVQIAAWGSGADLKLADGIKLTEIEDLIPTRIALEAARSYATSFLRLSGDEVTTLAREAIDSALVSAGGSVWKALEQAFAAAYDGAHIDKTGFAKELLAYVNTASGERRPPGLLDLEHNFGQLIRHLAELLADAERDEGDRRRKKRLGRIVKGFLDDHPDGTTKDSAEQTLRAIESSLDEADPEDDLVRAGITRLRRDFKPPPARLIRCPTSRSSVRT